jgi:hypothetical protein
MKLSDLFFREPARDVLGAVPIKCFDTNYNRSLRRGTFLRNPESGNQFSGLFVALYDARSAEDLQSLLSDIVHEKKGHPIIVLEISDADVLFVSSKIHESQRVVVYDTEETLWTASILNVRPSCFIYRSNVETVSRLYELSLGDSKPIAGFTKLFNVLILSPASMKFLLLLHQRRKRNLREFAAHNQMPPRQHCLCSILENSFDQK